MKSKALFLTYSFLLIIPINVLASHVPYMCTYDELTKCLNITESQSAQDTQKMAEFCANKYELTSKTTEEMLAMKAELYDCIVQQFKLSVLFKEEKLQQCEPIFMEINKIEAEKRKKESEEFEKKFHEIDM